jgi:hypothetical protein
MRLGCSDRGSGLRQGTREEEGRSWRTAVRVRSLDFVPHVIKAIEGLNRRLTRSDF